MHDKYYFESNAIRWSIIVLCIALMLVYVILYYLKGDLWKTELQQNHILNTWTIEDLNFNEEILVTEEQYDFVALWSWQEEQNLIVDTWNIQNYSGTDIDIDIENMIILSGTKTYYWELDFVEKLRIWYNYALVDEKWIYYLNMTNHDYDFSAIVRKWSWSLYVINTDQELIANSLFGDKVTFINIPDYKNKIVLFLLDIDDQSWLLAIDYPIYHQVKPYLKSLFIY